MYLAMAGASPLVQQMIHKLEQVPVKDYIKKVQTKVSNFHSMGKIFWDHTSTNWNKRAARCRRPALLSPPARTQQLGDARPDADPRVPLSEHQSPSRRTRLTSRPARAASSSGRRARGGRRRHQPLARLRVWSSAFLRVRSLACPRAQQGGQNPEQA